MFDPGSVDRARWGTRRAPKPVVHTSSGPTAPRCGDGLKRFGHLRFCRFLEHGPAYRFDDPRDRIIRIFSRSRASSSIMEYKYMLLWVCLKIGCH